MDGGNITTAANGSVAVGAAALAALIGGAGNTAVGYHAGEDTTTGAYNTFIGYGAGQEFLAGNRNTALGYNALGATATGANLTNSANCTAIGTDALGGNWVDSGSGGDNNTAIGKGSMSGAINGGTHNVGVGIDTLAAIVNGARNVAIGNNALTALTGGGTDVLLGNIAVGYGALDNLQTGESNIAIGLAAMDAATGAVSDCVIIGDRAGDAINSTNSNGTVAIGYHALGALVNGSSNTAIGYQSMLVANHADCDQNTCVGFISGNAITEGQKNTLIGNEAGATRLTTGDKNTAVGAETLGKGGGSALTGDSNTAIGFGAGLSMAGAPAHNVLVGHLAGDGLTTATKCTMIGAETEPNAVGADNQTAVGYGAQGHGDDTVTLGDGAVNQVHMGSDSDAVMYANGTINTSDERFKKNVEDTDLGLEFINKVRPVKYNYKVDKGDGKKRYGIIAQETLEVLQDLDKKDFAGIKTDDPDRLGADYIQFVAPLIAAIQELSQQVEELKAKIN
jgi:hypothetical protein